MFKTSRKMLLRHCAMHRIVRTFST